MAFFSSKLTLTDWTICRGTIAEMDVGNRMDTRKVMPSGFQHSKLFFLKAEKKLLSGRGGGGFCVLENLNPQILA